jgi:cytochrome c-type biogenesis protein CcmH/NrfG
MSLLLYQFTGDKIALSDWLAEGKQHYKLLEQFEALGGIDGAINKITQRLKANPDDKQGWLILGKLYQAKHNEMAAEVAFAQARELK